MYDLDGMAKQVKERMNRKRFVHTQGVCYTCGCLAMRYGADMEQAMVAGLLHDNAKCFSDEKMIAKCEKHQIDIRPIEREYPYLLHGKLGAFYAKKHFGVDDVQVHRAITYHTTGRPDMSLLEKIVFVADYIEPNRKPISGLEEIRKMAFIDLDGCVLRILENTISYLNHPDKKKRSMDTQTLEAYEFYKEEKTYGSKRDG